MIYRVDNASAGVELSPEKFARRVAVFVKIQGIVDDVDLDAKVNAMTDAQVVAACRVLLKALITVWPIGTP